MPSFLLFRTRAGRLLVAGLATLLWLDAGAQVVPPTSALREQFPVASIDSEARAEAALVAAHKARDAAEKEYRAEGKACMSTLLVNACLERQRDVRRKRIAEIDGVELEANRFKRRDRSYRVEADRAKREADRAANAPADAAQRARNHKTFDERQEQAAREKAARTRSDAIRAAPTKPHGPAIKVKPPGDAAKEAAQRAKNVVDHDAKRVEADEHLAKLNQRMAAKVADRKRRADEKAVKDARGAATKPPAPPAAAP